MVTFQYRKITQAELDQTQFKCETLKDNHMPCHVHAKMRIVRLVDNDIENPVSKENVCMGHFIIQLQAAKASDDCTLVNLDDFASAQELQIHNGQLKADQVKDEKNKEEKEKQAVLKSVEKVVIKTGIAKN